MRMCTRLIVGLVSLVIAVVAAASALNGADRGATATAAEVTTTASARVATHHPGLPAQIAKQPRVSPEQQELFAIQAEGQRKVAELVRQMTGLPAGPALRDLQVQVQQAKLDAELQFLTALARQARESGDLARALEAERTATMLRSPHPAAGSVPPASLVKPPEKGGQP